MEVETTLQTFGEEKGRLIGKEWNGKLCHDESPKNRGKIVCNLHHCIANGAGYLIQCGKRTVEVKEDKTLHDRLRRHGPLLQSQNAAWHYPSGGSPIQPVSVHNWLRVRRQSP